MRPRSGALTLFFFFATCSAAQPGFAKDAAKDIPAGHWARKDVEAVLKYGAMDAPGGKFSGDSKVVRVDLARAMAGFGKSLEKGVWQPATGKKFKVPVPDTSPSVKAGVTRYELASAIAKFGAYTASALKQSDKRYAKSIVIPKLTSPIKKDDPARASIEYLAKNRMIMPDSILLKSGNNPVTGRDVADALASVVTGAIDLNTDEPQNKETIERPDRPSSQKGTPTPRPGSLQR